ncbi:hypothetical protein [Streptomyces albidoflavus]|uniref:hypothetical protein n=1 Tax=Streptomyces albidoflavus TaxID=1886 RepID=UPI001596FB01|nr:hypothetical protein [Streptomyces albidoflavus]
MQVRILPSAQQARGPQEKSWAYTRLTHAEVPADHLARAVAYVATTRALWLQRQGGTHPS